jgi:hypothetical protein
VTLGKYAPASGLPVIQGELNQMFGSEPAQPDLICMSVSDACLLSRQPSDTSDAKVEWGSGGALC